MEFREQLKYPPTGRIAMLTLKGRNEEKVKFSAEHLKRELEKVLKEPAVAEPSQSASLFEAMDDVVSKESAEKLAKERAVFRDLVISGPAPAPLLRAENYYRYQLMLRTRAMSRLSRSLAEIVGKLVLPDDVTLAVDIDPVNLS